MSIQPSASRMILLPVLVLFLPIILLWLDHFNVVSGFTPQPLLSPPRYSLQTQHLQDRSSSYSSSSSSPFISIHQPRNYIIMQLSALNKKQENGGDSTDNDSDFNNDDDEDHNNDDYIVTIGTKIPTQSSPNWDMYNDFPQFINQCTVQSFVFLLRTCHDIHTVQYIENFTQPMIDPILPSRTVGTLGTTTNSGPLLLTYHGINAMNRTAFPKWDTYYELLLQQPKQILVIESYQKHIPTYEIDINPVSLCHRMMSVREQIAKEMAHDLYIIAQMKTTITTTTATNRNTAHGPSRNQLAMDDVLFLDTWDANDGDYIMPSPLRKGNFDLLLLFITQESIHRILNQNTYSTRERRQSLNDKDDDSFMLSQAEEQLLSNFYLHRLVTHFTGQQRYGRANQFLQELLLLVVVNDVSASDDATVALVSAQRIVEHILHIRQQVAMEYSQYAADVPNLHIPIKKIQLNLLMQSYNSKDSPTSQSTNNSAPMPFSSSNELQ